MTESTITRSDALALIVHFQSDEQSKQALVDMLVSLNDSDKTQLILELTALHIARDTIMTDIPDAAHWAATLMHAIQQDEIKGPQ